MLVWYTVCAKSQEVVALDFLRSGKIKCLANRYLRLAFFIIAYAIAKLILATDIATRALTIMASSRFQNSLSSIDLASIRIERLVAGSL